MRSFNRHKDRVKEYHKTTPELQMAILTMLQKKSHEIELFIEIELRVPFPFDEQQCCLKFGSWTYSENLLNLELLDGNVRYEEEVNERGEVDNITIAEDGIEPTTLDGKIPLNYHEHRVSMDKAVDERIQKLYYSPQVLKAFENLVYIAETLKKNDRNDKHTNTNNKNVE
ncbi:hypothetical protein NECAME_02751 [Necator americanus]|uniref:Neurotransmitter-gated ion-channel ligand-binding domain-containing protein n=1 Tax=Necator americanus TaxID=51031 RepID=W2TD10_NECAM|nr:hypothetical protein NECAME_02751 [Necator americanus]ETN78887.1 hypothetical protein NECAME_02751 [Necator americanus]